MWLEATRVRTPPGSMLSRLTVSPVHIAASERVVGNPQGRHGLADNVFTDHRPERCAPVAAAGKLCRSGSFELDVIAPAVGAEDFAEQHRPAIAELGHEVSELMPGIGLRYGLRPRRDGISGKNCDAFLAAQIGRVDAKALRQRIVKPEQFRRCDFGRGDALVEGAGKARVAVVERNSGCGFRRWGRGIILQGCKAVMALKLGFQSEKQGFVLSGNVPN